MRKARALYEDLLDTLEEKLDEIEENGFAQEIRIDSLVEKLELI